MSQIQPIVLSGGSGTRLWPLSREAHPKQFLPLTSDRSLLQETVTRVADSDRFLPPIVVCNAEHRFLVAEQLRQTGVAPAASVLEPAARNTAPAVAVGAMMAVTGNSQQLILVLPSDHAIRRPDAFRIAVETGLAAAMAGKLVTFGVKPSGPETGYGYIYRPATRWMKHRAHIPSHASWRNRIPFERNNFSTEVTITGTAAFF
jgi:mannose-1-phosphate guanylyltransferase/mannose-6-phosphate isomerase